MKRKGDVKQLGAVVNEYYEKKWAIDGATAETNLNLAMVEGSLRALQHQPPGDAASKAPPIKQLRERKKKIKQLKKTYDKSLSQRKVLVDKNIKAKAAGYKYWHTKGSTPKLGDRPHDAYLFNCVASHFSHSRIGPTCRNIDNMRIHINGPRASLQFGENYFRYAENVEGPDNPITGFGSFCFDTHNFYFTFEFDEYAFQDGTIRIKTLAHPNGGYFCWQDDTLPGQFSQSWVWMLARTDFAQLTPTGQLQVWEGDVKELCDKRMSTFDAFGITMKPWSGYLPEDFRIDHGEVRPIYNGYPFIITVHFQANFIAETCGQAALDVVMNVPMVSGEIYY